MLSADVPPLHPAQAAILAESRRFNVVNCGRRFGKTVLGINLAIAPALAGYPVGWFAPEYKLLDEAWDDIKQLVADVTAKANDQQKRITLLNGGRIDAWSFDRNPNAGRSRKYKRVVIDEAAHCKNLKDVWTKAVRPTLTDFEGDGWFLSSPRGKTYFHTLYLKGLDREGQPPGSWKSWTKTSYDNPYLNPAEIDSARDDLGPVFFGQEYLAEFLDDLLQQLIPSDWLDAAAAASPIRSGPTRMSIDLAEGQGDPAGVLVRDDNGILVAEIGQWTLENTATKAALLAQRYRVEGHRVTFDAGGVGSDFRNRLEAVGIRSAKGYKGGSKGGQSFATLRSAAAWLFRQRLDPGRLDTDKAAPLPVTPFAIPRDLLDGPMGDELRALKYTLNNDRQKALEPKEEMAATLGRSPTFADLCGMAWAYPNA